MTDKNKDKKKASSEFDFFINSADDRYEGSRDTDEGFCQTVR